MMRRACLAACVIVLGAAAPLRAQQDAWNDARTAALVQLATERRAQQLADTGLADYRAVAHGYLTFLAQLGEGFREPPKVVKADQLALEVYWKAPDLSKQHIIGRRDTLLLPTDIQYHRDHLGIVQNNFPEIIRLGDGDEVRDVPHPLSSAGLAAYDFAIADSLRLSFPGRSIEVYEVRVRPKDDRQARVVGALFIERGTGQVVRMAFGFTRAAFLDKYLEDLSIVLENGLVDTRYWLPRRQEIEIRRTGTWLELPARGIIRGRWEIGDYQLNAGLPTSLFAGPEIVAAPPAVRNRYPWPGRILDSLPPDVRAVNDAEVVRVQSEARALVRAQALQRARGPALSARGVSDLLRFNRVEGFAAGGGVSRQLGGGVVASARARWGFADERLKGEAALGWQHASGRGLRIFASRDLRQLGEEPERAGVVNSVAAQEFGSDWTNPLRVDQVGIAAERGAFGGWLLRLQGAMEWQDSAEVNARPATGRFEPVIAAASLDGIAITASVERPTVLAPFGFEVSGRAAVRAFVSTMATPTDAIPDFATRFELGKNDLRWRLSFGMHAERPMFAAQQHRLVLRTAAALVPAARWLSPQELVYFGGMVTAPGYDFHSLTGWRGLSQRVEWRAPVPFPSVKLGRYGRAPARATLAPYLNVALLGGSLTTGITPATPSARVYPSAGIALLTLFDLLRLDVARGLNDGRWMFGVDVSRDFWRVL